MEKKIKEEIFTVIQKFLKHPPIIIWGSGATIPYGLPSMDELKEKLKPHLNIDQEANLEVKLEEIQGEKNITKIKKIIRDEVLEKDRECLKNTIKNTNNLEAIKKMINKFYSVHPKNVNIITTNYDCILEYALSQYGYNYTDGFSGRPLSKFRKEAFMSKNCINLIKVHGSINWSSKNGGDSFFNFCEIDQLEHTIILPSKNKYQDSYREPYRTLITKSDEYIDQASSFLVIGFGFNDEHLTPKIENKIKEGTPIVILTETATQSCKAKLENSIEYCLLEKDKEKTKVSFKEKRENSEKCHQLDGSYWKLNDFMEVL